MTITRHGRRFWRVEEEDGTLVCVTVYKKGAEEVARRLTAARAAGPGRARSRHPLRRMAERDRRRRKERG